MGDIIVNIKVSKRHRKKRKKRKERKKSSNATVINEDLWSNFHPSKSKSGCDEASPKVDLN